MTFSICSSFIHEIFMIYVLCSRERNISRLKRQSICLLSFSFLKAGKWKEEIQFLHTVQKQAIGTGGYIKHSMAADVNS